MCPSPSGGNNFWPSTYSPKTKLIYIPSNVVHSALATPDADVIFLTAKDMSHGIAGTPA